MIRLKDLLEQKSDYAIDQQMNALMHATGIRSAADASTVQNITRAAQGKDDFSVGKIPYTELKRFPLHVRAFWEFLKGRTISLTEKDLTSEELSFLKNAAEQFGITNGFKYNKWRSIGASGPTALTSKGSQKDVEKYGDNTLSVISADDNLASSFMYTLGEVDKSNVYKDPDGTIIVKDHYDFNTDEYGGDTTAILNDFKTAVENYYNDQATIYQVIRNAANIIEAGGNIGFPVEIRIS